MGLSGFIKPPVLGPWNPDGGGGSGGGGGAPAGGASPDDDRVIRDQLRQLAAWSKANQRDSNRDRLRFLAFKIPAFIATTLTATLEKIGGYHDAVIGLGLAAALLIGIDTLVPGGNLFRTFRRAVYDISQLYGKVELEWQGVVAAHPSAGSNIRRESFQKLIAEINTERTRISGYLAAAEAGGAGGVGG